MFNTFPVRLSELRRLYDAGCLDMADVGNLLGLDPMDAARKIGVGVEGDVLVDGSRVRHLGDYVGPCPDTAEHGYRRGYAHAIRDLCYGEDPMTHLIPYLVEVAKWKAEIAGVQDPPMKCPPRLRRRRAA